MDIRNQVQRMDAMVAQGDIVNAVKDFFCDKASTSDYGSVTTDGKQQMVDETGQIFPMDFSEDRSGLSP